MNELFEPVDLGKLTLPNLVVMSPMSRNRAAAGGLVTDLTVEYYTQRAAAGLIITEGTQPSVIGQGYVDSPGLHSQAQVAAWRKVTDAVHARGGRIFAQLMHSGRVGHPCLYPDGALPVAPSAIPTGGRLYTGETLLDHPVPRPMTLADIDATVGDYAAAARNAIAAGFDGVEVHGANGFLIHQFLCGSSNARTDAYGGSVTNRIRFAVEVAGAVSDAIGPERTGLRISPAHNVNGISERDSAEVYPALVRALTPYHLAYLHIMEFGGRDITRGIRALWPGALLLNPHATAEEKVVTPESALAVVREGLADAVSLATMWLANPDLIDRIKAGGPYNAA
ncbi:alkene reductase, partial [Nonomuraea sp. NN258]|uniref:alkene reductase n=1 Tax=Nonomuraea antri TaxID=2730852 RepID=UPI00156A13F4